MSSATSIERDLPVKGGTPPAAGRDRTSARDSFQPWHFFVLVSLLAATAAVLSTRQARPEHLVLISLTIGAAGFAAGALYRTLLPLVSRDEPASTSTLSQGMRATLEREKMLALRSIKELEFDRAMGKISPKDFDEMAGRLRVRAMSLMRQLDDDRSGYRDSIEQEVSKRLRERGPAGKAGRRAPEHAGGAATVANGRKQDLVCVCGTSNDADAAFCKRCGSRLHEGAGS
jgi:hypothetical protein